MPGQDPLVAVEQHRIGETELPDRPCDPRNLLCAMRPRVAGIGDQLVDPPVEDRQLAQLTPTSNFATLRALVRGGCLRIR